MRTLHITSAITTEIGDIGMTIRKGSKWGDVVEGEIINLCVCDLSISSHTVVGQGEVTNIKWSGKFKDLPARIIELEHVEECKTYSGLFARLCRNYPGFSEEDLISAFAYKRIS